MARVGAFLKHEPGSTKSKKALNKIFILLRERNKEDEPVELKNCRSLLSKLKVEVESVSDSSDWKHGGNGLPCPYHNHDGHTRDVKCEFSHRPDHKHVRDRMCAFSSGFSCAEEAGFRGDQRAQRLCELFTRSLHF